MPSLNAGEWTAVCVGHLSDTTPSEVRTVGELWTVAASHEGRLSGG
jgi:hypothetical protein